MNLGIIAGIFLGTDNYIPVPLIGILNVFFVKKNYEIFTEPIIQLNTELTT